MHFHTNALHIYAIRSMKTHKLYFRLLFGLLNEWIISFTSAISTTVEKKGVLYTRDGALEKCVFCEIAASKRLPGHPEDPEEVKRLVYEDDLVVAFKTQDAFQKGTLAHAISAKQSNALTALDGQVHAKEDL